VHLEFQTDIRQHVNVDKAGFVWVNLHAGEDVQIKWEDQYRSAVDGNPRMQLFLISTMNSGLIMHGI
jgi:hypothetical protein